MPRKQRIEYEGAFYHVITRGNQKQAIFKQDEDFQKYLKILTCYKERYNYHIYSYVLMKNHVHLIIETKHTLLSKIMQGINQSYTMYFNRKYETVGHLFQGRYKAILCDKDKYLLSLLKYIHENPIRAKLVKSISEYPWSSHRIYEKKESDDTLVDTDQVLRMFSEDNTKARQLYMAYIGEKEMIAKETVYSTVDQRVLGDEHFVEYVVDKNKGYFKKKQPNKVYSLQAIAKAMESVFGITLKEIRGKGKDPSVVKVKKIFCLTALEYGYLGKEVANFIEKDPAIVTRYGKEKLINLSEIESVMEELRINKVNSQV